MVGELQIASRLFQRGHTWNESLEVWSHDRDTFLEAVINATVMEKVKNCLGTWPVPLRLMIYYNPWSLDCCLNLPTIGKSLQACEGVSVRYFSQEHFFPVLHPMLGRRLPQIIILDMYGSCNAAWGPRPEKVSQKLNSKGHLKGKELDLWLLDQCCDGYHDILDESLAHFFWCNQPTKIS